MLKKFAIAGVLCVSSISGAAQAQDFAVNTAEIAAACQVSAAICQNAALAAIGNAPAEVRNSVIAVVSGVVAQRAETAPSTERRKYAEVLAELGGRSTDTAQRESLGRVASAVATGTVEDIRTAVAEATPASPS